MKISECFPSKYLKATDIAGRQIRVQIEKVAMEKMPDGNEEKPVVYFSNKDRGLVLNRINSTVLREALGDDPDEWKGRSIELSTTLVNYQGRMVDGIRIRVPVPAPVQECVDADIPF